MNKNEFLKQLESLLSDLPEEERREAMEYYVEYFDEAGTEKEADVLKELGSPNEVANHIREDLAGKELIPYENITNGGKKDDNNGWKIACIAILCVFAAPIVIPLAIALGATVVSLIIGIISVIVGIFVAVCAVTFAFAVVALVLFIVGIIKVFSTPLLGLMLIGISLTCTGLAILFGFLVFKFCVVALPAMCRGIGKLFNKMFGKKKEEA